MKRIIPIALIAAILLLAGCQTPITISILTINTRAPASNTGEVEQLIEGGGHPNVSPTVDVSPLP